MHPSYHLDPPNEHGRLALPLCATLSDSAKFDAPLPDNPGGEDSLGRALIQESRPRTRHAHWVALGDRIQLFVVNGSQVYDVEAGLIEQLAAASQTDDLAVVQLMERLGLGGPPLIDDVPLTNPPLHALSLAIAQKCNLACSYCYASHGNFGGDAKNMDWPTAQRAVEMLVDRAKLGSRLNLAFLGGEPLLNRSVLRAATEFAVQRTAERGMRIGFSITTNGTLLSEDDAAFFERHGFAVTISLDGPRTVHDRQRPSKAGAGTFDQIMERVRPLLAMQQRMQVSVRATVMPGQTYLRETLDEFLAMKFHSVGFSPVLRSPAGAEFTSADISSFLTAMTECGFEFERRVLRGQRYAFANIVNALHELHRGTHRPYPCGAGAGYLGVSADGDLAACHRFVGDAEGKMGDLSHGIDARLQNQWLKQRHVHTQSPCGDCWARYLCSGGCHHEVIARGRPACDYIRGWLHYCLQAYGRLTRLRPDWFDDVVMQSNKSRSDVPRPF